MRYSFNMLASIGAVILLASPHAPQLVPPVQQLFSPEPVTPLRVAAVGEEQPSEGASAVLTESGTAAAPTDAGAKTGLQQARRVAVYELELQGVDPNVGTVVTDSLLAEIRKLQGVAAIGMDEIKDMLSHEANKQILGCEADDECLAEIGGALGVDDLITGKLSKVGDNHVMLVRRIDQRQAKVIAVFNKRLKAGSGQEFLLSIGPAVEQLFAGRNIRAGLSRGVPNEVALRLDPPPLPTAAFWSVAGAAGAAAVVGGVFGLLSLQQQDAFNGLLYPNGPPPAAPADSVPGSQLMGHYNAAQDNALAANISFGTAGALAIAAGVMYLFTDWEGYGDHKD